MFVFFFLVNQESCLYYNMQNNKAHNKLYNYGCILQHVLKLKQTGSTFCRTEKGVWIYLETEVGFVSNSNSYKRHNLKLLNMEDNYI